MQQPNLRESKQTLLSSRTSYLQTIFPSLKWLSSYDLFQFITDIFAGLTVGLVCSVQGLSYSLLARLPQSVSFHFAVPMFVEALLSSSRNLIGGPVALVSLNVGQSISPQWTSFTALELASVYSLYVGLLLIILGLLGGGHLSKYVSPTVILGFTSAVAIIIICNELGALLGISVLQSAYAWEVVGLVFRSLHQLNISSTLLSVCILIYFYVSKYYFSSYLQRVFQSVHASIWYSFFMVGILITITLVNWMTHFSSHFGMEVVGSVPQSFPRFRLPGMEALKDAFRLRTISTLTLLVLIESTSIALSLASKQQYSINLNREVTSLGLANIFGGFVQCYPFAASFSRSAVNANAGAKTPVAQIVAALFLAFASWGLAGFISFIPKCLLASIICVSVSGLIEWEEWRRLYRLDIAEWLVFTASFLAPLFFGSVLGLGLAILVCYLPIVVSLWRILDFVNIWNVDWWKHCFVVWKEKRREPRQVVFRLPQLLFFINAISLQRSMKEELEKVENAVDNVVLDASLVVYMDVVALDMLESLLRGDEIARQKCVLENVPPRLLVVLKRRKLNELVRVSVPHADDVRDDEYRDLLQA